MKDTERQYIVKIVGAMNKEPVVVGKDDSVRHGMLPTLKDPFGEMLIKRVQAALLPLQDVDFRNADLSNITIQDATATGGRGRAKNTR